MSYNSDETFTEGQLEELSLFTLPPVQTGVERVYCVENRPISQLTSQDAAIEFNISGNGTDYLDLRRSKLYVKLKIVNGDGTPLERDVDVGVTNNLLHTLWSQIDVSLGGKLITSSDNKYPYKALFNVFMKYGADAQNYQLQSHCFYKDTAGFLEYMVFNGGNYGFYKRSRQFAESKSVELEGFLHEDVFANNNRFILNGVDVNIKLYRNRVPFCLLHADSSKQFQIILEDVIFKACKIKINMAVLLGHSKALQKVTAKYPLIRSEVKSTSIPAGQISFVWEDMFLGKCPRRMIIGFVNAAACVGTLDRNPFNFKYYNLNQIGVTLNGENVHGQPLKLQTGDGVISLSTLYDVSGKWQKDDAIPFEISDIQNGYALYAFSLQPYASAPFRSLEKAGHVQLQAYFGQPLTESVTVIAFCEYDSCFEINEARDIIQSNCA
jgi:hypothetical protein